MAGNILLSISLIFVALAAVFVGITLQNFLKEEKRMTIRRTVGLKMAFIFLAVAIGLSFLNIFIR